MRYVIMAIRDSAVGTFGRPIFTPAIGVGVRSFGDEVNRQGEHDLFRHPDDFELFHLGFFDDQSAQFELLPVPVSVIRGVDVRHKGSNGNGIS